MKKLFILCVLLTSSVYSVEFSIEEKAQLFTLKMMFQMQRTEIVNLVETVRENVQSYSELDFLEFKDKRLLEAKNCGEIKSVIGMNLLMVATALEESKDALGKMEVSDETVTDLSENSFAYIKKFKKASDKCKEVEKSYKLLEDALTNINVVTDIYEKILPDMLSTEE